MITFNTGRNYTEHGQRIAAQRVASGAVVMVGCWRGNVCLIPAYSGRAGRYAMQSAS